MSTRNRWLILIGLIVASVVLDIAVGFGIANHERGHEILYRTALKTTEPDRFNYIVKSQQGNVVSYAKIAGQQSAKFHEMTTKRHFMAVKRTLERYTMQTRTVSDSKGNTHTETYWTWDYAGSDNTQAKQLRIFGHNYHAAKFNLHPFYRDIDADKLINHDTGFTGSYYYLNGMERYSYEVIPMMIKGSFIADTSKGTLDPVQGKQIKLSKEHYKDYLNHNLYGGKRKVIIVVVLLVLLEIGGCAYFWLVTKEMF